MSSPIVRRNHFVPELYLKNFTDSRDRVWRYSLLVSSRTTRDWKFSFPASIGYHRDLYTFAGYNNDSDDLEHWLNSEFETSASVAVQRAVQDERLTRNDWEVLIKFLASQSVRTPAFMLRHLPRWKKSVAQQMENTQARIKSLIESNGMIDPPFQEPFLKLEKLPIKFSTQHDVENRKTIVSAKAVVGRAMWHYAMRRALESTSKVLHSHKWTILRPYKGYTFFTSDDPVVQLNYHSRDRFDFGGGWGSQGTEIFLPLSPQHLMYTQVGHPRRQRGTTISEEQTIILRQMIAKHAHRHIFSAAPDEMVSSIRPRVVSQEQVKDERQQWQQWHHEQSLAENEIFVPD